MEERVGSQEELRLVSRMTGCEPVDANNLRLDGMVPVFGGESRGWSTSRLRFSLGPAVWYSTRTATLTPGGILRPTPARASC